MNGVGLGFGKCGVFVGRKGESGYGFAKHFGLF